MLFPHFPRRLKRTQPKYRFRNRVADRQCHKKSTTTLFTTHIILYPIS